mgnify:CR=1 FL=1
MSCGTAIELWRICRVVAERLWRSDWAVTELLGCGGDILVMLGCGGAVVAERFVAENVNKVY